MQSLFHLVIKVGEDYFERIVTTVEFPVFAKYNFCLVLFIFFIYVVQPIGIDLLFNSESFIQIILDNNCIR